MGRRSDRRRVLRLRAGATSSRGDSLAVEEPMEIRVGGRQVAVTMRTPGDDFELATGFLVSEGMLTAARDVVAVRYCASGRPDRTYNQVDVTVAAHVAVPDDARRLFVSSACGVCGKDSLDQVRTSARWSVADDPARVSSTLLAGLPDRLRAGQAVFERTGGLHAAGLFTANGDLLCLREDVGRHNAVDKVVGWALAADRLPLRGCILQVSGRLSFELVQKAWMAGVPVLSAVSAPSTLAVDLAVEAGMTVAGFVRDGGMNIYAGAERVDVPVADDRSA
ncbi:formate dehydrogenase accessory sulfurtransferase FdhD [Nocardioides sp. HM23]|uniref:formate dehydrogenase accessory sulfurtransferase FdhD n=1 Tax=Nocardioides bizhenqiangii TaxID=3095076 RepID=UPI002ACA71AD|nr:formate dehydrogenase accessory sulfurtransferase FdhD [Nocardioides sp. HM23]MDZ5621716.1 formate dehydrogenase accessory sulfurtransferase FdhD [Nocardioides sp. HM23]